MITAEGRDAFLPGPPALDCGGGLVGAQSGMSEETAQDVS